MAFQEFLNSLSPLLYIFLVIPLLFIYALKEFILAKKGKIKEFSPKWKETSKILFITGTVFSIITLYFISFYLFNLLLVVTTTQVCLALLSALIFGILTPVFLNSDNSKDFAKITAPLAAFNILVFFLLMILNDTQDKTYMRFSNSAAAWQTIGFSISFSIGIFIAAQRYIKKYFISSERLNQENNKLKVIYKLLPKNIVEIFKDKSFLAKNLTFKENDLNTSVQLNSSGFLIETKINKILTTFNFMDNKYISIKAQNGNNSKIYTISYNDIKLEDYAFLTTHLSMLYPQMEKAYQNVKNISSKENTSNKNLADQNLELSNLLKKAKDLSEDAKEKEMLEYLETKGGIAKLQKLYEDLQKRKEVEKN